MSRQRYGFVGLATIAALAFWLLLAGPPRLLGIDTGNAGMVLLMAVAWASLHAVSRMPDGGLGGAMSPGEWRAWIGFAFTLAVAVYAVSHASAFDARPLWNNPDAGRVGRNIVLLLVAWTTLVQVLGARWRRGVQEDERDRSIEAGAAQAARGVLVACTIGLAMLLGFSPADRLAWAPMPMIAHLLVIALILSCLVEYAWTAIAYWRDRH